MKVMQMGSVPGATLGVDAVSLVAVGCRGYWRDLMMVVGKTIVVCWWERGRDDNVSYGARNKINHVFFLYTLDVKIKLEIVYSPKNGSEFFLMLLL